MILSKNLNKHVWFKIEHYATNKLKIIYKSNITSLMYSTCLSFKGEFVALDLL